MSGTETVKTVRIALVSPSDVADECDRVHLVVDEFNRARADLKFTLWHWETDAHSRMHAGGAQASTDDLMKVDELDLVIGIFWSRFGTPTLDAQSGTEHELRNAWAAWRRQGWPNVMVFFCDRGYPTDIDPDQLKRLKQFQEDLPQEQMWWSYRTPLDLERAVRRQIGAILFDLLETQDDKADLARAENAGVVEPSAYASPLDGVFCEPYVANSERFRAAMRGCETLSMLGFSHNRMAYAYSADLSRIAQKGRLRVLAIDPKADAVLEANARSYIPKPPDAARHQHEAALTLFSAIGSSGLGPDHFEMRLIDCMPPFTVYVFNEDDPATASAWIWLTPWRVSSDRRPGFVATASVDPGWFRFYVEQFQLMWAAFGPSEA